jgi:DNA-binding NarL/FixJ family response regulator
MAQLERQQWIIQVISSHGLARRIIAETLEKEPQFDVRVPNHDEDHVETGAAVCVMDTEGADRPLFARLRVLRAVCPTAKFVAVCDDGSGLALSLRIGGVNGLVWQRELGRDLIPTVLAVLRGKVDFPCSGPEASPRLTAAFPESPEPLTERESVVYGLLLRRLQNWEIARELGVKESTIKSHVSSILSKTGAANRRDLACVV